LSIEPDQMTEIINLRLHGIDETREGREKKRCVEEGKGMTSRRY